MTAARDSFLLMEGLSNQSRLLVHGFFPEGEKKTEMFTEEGWRARELNKCERGRGARV